MDAVTDSDLMGTVRTELGIIELLYYGGHFRTRREYHQIEWPLRSRKYEYGVYVDEVLQHFFPPALGVISNITAG